MTCRATYYAGNRIMSLKKKRKKTYVYGRISKNHIYTGGYGVKKYLQIVCLQEDI